MGSSKNLLFGGVPGYLYDQMKKSRKAAERSAKQERELIARQKQREQTNLAESEDELARRRLLRETGGRRSLIASDAMATTAPKGSTSLLGG